MKKYKAGILISIMAIFLTGCGQIATPDELLVQPALSLEKKAMKEAIDTFLPEGCSVITLGKGEKIDGQDSFSKIDLNGDGNSEMVFFYKDKKTKIIGGQILTEKNGTWSKLCDLPLDASDILRYKVIDLDDDGKKEIIIGSYSSDLLQEMRNLKIFGCQKDSFVEILNMPYNSMDVADMNRDRLMEVAILFRVKDTSENRIRVVHIKDNKIYPMDEIAFAHSKEPFSLKIGPIYDHVQAIFVDSFTEGYGGYTDIFFLGSNRIRDFQEVHRFKLPPAKVPIRSEDIDKDGFIEVGYPFFPPENKPDDNTMMTDEFALSYYKIRRDGQLIFSKQVYYNYRLSFTLNIPTMFVNHYDLKLFDNEARVEFYFFSQDKISYPLFEVILLDKQDWEEQKASYQFLAEKENQILVGKLAEDISEELSKEDQEKYKLMRASLMEMDKVIKPSAWE